MYVSAVCERESKRRRRRGWQTEQRPGLAGAEGRRSCRPRLTVTLLGVGHEEGGDWEGAARKQGDRLGGMARSVGGGIGPGAPQCTLVAQLASAAEGLQRLEVRDIG